MTPTALLAFSLYLLDWNQTLTLSSLCKQSPEWRESNLILGSCPSNKRVNAYFAGIVASHMILNYTLPKQYANFYNYAAIGVEVSAVGANYSIGIKVDF